MVDNPSLVVQQAGPSTTFQDLGRPGYGSLGVSASGAADRASHRLANRLVGNRPTAPSLEVTMGPLSVRSEAYLLIAVTGAMASVTRNGAVVANNAPFTLAPGDVVVVSNPVFGLRSYLSVRGGFSVALVLGSASYDVLGGIGPPPLQDGDLLFCGDPAEAEQVTTDLAPVAALTDHHRLDVVPGPDATGPARRVFDALVHQSWTVSTHTNRVGVGLNGQPIRNSAATRAAGASRPVLRGAVQLPPDGQPVIFGPDHPTTGGYDVIAVVIDGCLDRTGQARPGDRISFRVAR